MLTIGSLFSGIGGLELGLEWAGLGPTLWQVEQNAMCRAVLARHWPGVDQHEDVCRVGASTLAPVDLICGGFPCQDLSSAGRRAGLAGDRSGLWYQFARIIAECGPRFVVIENVRSGAGKWVDAIRGELERLGYASLPIPISASDCGAPHERARVFVVGCIADGDGERSGARGAGRPARGRARPADEASPGVATDADVSERSAPQARQFRSDVEATEPARSGGFTPHAHRARQPQPRRPNLEIGRWPCDADRCWASEPDVARVAHGLSGRVDRERALGNAVVPQCAEVVGHVIRQLIKPQG